MEEFRADTRKMNAYSKEIGDFEKRLRGMQEEVSSIQGNLRHKLSAMEGIGQALKKIEGNLETETAMMLGLGSALGAIADNYRHTERGIVDFGTGSISGGQLADMQKDASAFEDTLEASRGGEFSMRVPVYLGGSNGKYAFVDDVIEIFKGGGDEGEYIAHLMEGTKKRMENGVKAEDMCQFAAEEGVKKGILEGLCDWCDDKLPEWCKDSKEILEDLLKFKERDEYVFDLKK
ncbi:hypothetical protein D3Z51_06270 [Clostridiaceae bacterium]|nr:hypothetical protein [Clostridiaceae bacterium]